MSLRVWHGIGSVACSELFACVVFRLKRFVVKAVFSHVVVRRQTRTDTDTDTHTQAHTHTHTDTDRDTDAHTDTDAEK